MASSEVYHAKVGPLCPGGTRGKKKKKKKIKKKKKKKKIKKKVILRDSPKARERQVLGPQQLREVRLVSPDYDYHGMFYIWNDKIALFSFGDDLTALVIESAELAQMQKAAFQVMWGSLYPNSA